MSAVNHKVQRILLELTNSEGETYQSDEKEFSVLLNGSISLALEELLDEADKAGTTIHIPKMAVDLGPIQRPFQKETIVSLFKEKLRSQLKEELENNKGVEADRHRKGIDILIYFLRNGHLPWWASDLPSAADLRDPDFVTEFKNYFFSEAASTWVERLATQFTNKELSPIIAQLISPRDQNDFDNLNMLMLRLSSSDDFVKRKTAQRILKKTLSTLISKKGRLGSFETFIVEFISEEPGLKHLSIEKTSEYLEDISIKTIPSLVEAKKQSHESAARSASTDFNQQPHLADKENILLHFLSFGSLPNGDLSLSRNELDFLFKELVLKRSKKIRDLFLKKPGVENTFLEFLVNLPYHYFETLFASLQAGSNGLIEILKKRFSELHTPTAFPELRTLASVLILNQVLTKNEVPVSQLLSQSRPFLNIGEKASLKAFLSEIDPGLIETVDQKEIHPETSKKIDAIYFSDLLYYLFENESWPWWGNLYTQIYREIGTNPSLEKALESVIQNFEITHPASFTEITREIVNASLKPSLLFTKRDWEFSKKILDLTLPFFRNSLTDTIEAVLSLISDQKKMGLPAKIITQQFTFFIVDQKKEDRSNFKDLINAVITAMAVKLQAPLWEIYGILLKNYKLLQVKNGLTKEDASSLFVYHEMLEEQYVLYLQSQATNSGSTPGNFYEINLISDKSEEIILKYISGNDSAIKIFPSAWALGQFISESLKTSPTLSSALKNYLNGNDIGFITRIIRLGEISRMDWISDLLEEKEDVLLSKELFELLQKLTSENDIVLKNTIRASLIREKHFAGARFSPGKLKTVLKAISTETGVAFLRVELELLQNISVKNTRGALFENLHEEPVTRNETPETETKTFVNRLRELTFKEYLSELSDALKESNDANRVAELFVTLESIYSRKDLSSWIDKIRIPQDKKIALKSIAKIDDEAETTLLIEFFKTSLAPILENKLKTLLAEPMFPVFIQPLIDLVGAVKNIALKTALRELIENAHYHGRKTFVEKIEALPDFAEKSELIRTASVNFPEENFIGKYFENLKARQKNTLQNWKEKLNFDLSLTDELVEFTTIKNLKRPGLNEDIAAAVLYQPQSKHESEIPVSERQDEGISPLRLTPESAADILIYFIFNLELPWWSPVKDTFAFEKLLQDLSWSSPFALKNKIFETAQYHPDHFQNIVSALIADRNENINPPSKEDLDHVLKGDLDYLSDVFSEKQGAFQPLDYIDEILSKFQAIPFKNENIHQSFRKTVLSLLVIIDPDMTDLFKKDKNLSAEAESWSQAVETMLPATKFSDRKIEELTTYLKEREEDFNSAGLLKGISITDNLIAILGRGDTYRTADILNTWLQMLYTFTNSPTESLKGEIYRFAETIFSEEYSDTERFTKTATEESAHESIFLLPFANYINVLSLILDKVENISYVQRYTGLQLATRLLSMEEIKGDLSLPFGLTFKYLSERGVSSEEINNIILTLKDASARPELLPIFGRLYDIVNKVDPGNIYVEESGKQIEMIVAPPLNLGLAIDEIVKHFQDKKPVLVKLQSLTDPDKKQDLKNTITGEPRSQEMLEMDVDGRIYVPNAGLVILWPFLSRLFSNLKYTDKGKFVDPEKQVRAIHLSQYLVGFTEDHPEYTLTLNKLLCGLDLTEPVERFVNLTEKEKTEARNLLSSVITQWKEMNNTSVENFQRTFLQREGVVWQKDGDWYLKVGYTPFDILLLKLPWGLSMIKYPWNNYLIFVEWKAMN